MRLGSNASPLTSGRDRRFAVVVARFNAPVTDRLLAGCRDTLFGAGVAERDLKTVMVPGAFELPLVCQRLAATRRFDAVVALGCVIRGETPHDRYISQAVAEGLMSVSLATNVPVIFGVLTPLNERQARARSGAGSRNKGVEAARAALEMAALSRAR